MYKSIIRSLLFKFDPEAVHYFTFDLIKIFFKIPFSARLVRSLFHVNHPNLERELFGLKFKNPVGLAAGFDKNALLYNELAHFGFGFIEVGTVTPKAQDGNPKKRLFRLKADNGLINRMGFNNKGAEVMLQALSKNYPKGKRGIPVGVNIGKAKTTPLDQAVEDYVSSFRTLADQADYFTINISSPNTAGLRDLQGATYLRELLQAIRHENRAHAKKLGRDPHPLLLKIAPDLTFHEIDEIVGVLLELNYDGIIATNTTIQRPEGFKSKETGGLSGGEFIRRHSNEVINYIYKSTEGKLPIIGVGGIDSVEAAGEKMDAGASMVQIYTGWVYRGPFFARELARALKSKGEDWI